MAYHFRVSRVSRAFNVKDDVHEVVTQTTDVERAIRSAKRIEREGPGEAHVECDDGTRRLNFTSQVYTPEDEKAALRSGITRLDPWHGLREYAGQAKAKKKGRKKAAARA